MIKFQSRALFAALLFALAVLPPLAADSGHSLTGRGISLAIHVKEGRFARLVIHDDLNGRALEMPEAFTLVLKDGAAVRSSAMRMSPLQESFTGSGSAAVRSLCSDFSSAHVSAQIRWCLLIRADAHYFRQTVTVHAVDDLPIAQVRLLDFEDPGAHVSGAVRGSPIVDSGMFFGFEHPLSVSTVQDGHAVAYLSRQLPLRGGQSETWSSVVGVAAPGQMRRAFLAYIEAERPRPYRPFLHYNSWYDLGYGQVYDLAGALNRIHAFGDELVVKRHVELDSFLFDDGWDNPNSLWAFNSGFPHGFTNAARAARRYHAGVGVWLSPWGGYEEKAERLAYGRKHGYEIINDGFALSGPRYFQSFQRICFQMIDRYGVNQFKIDGTGNANRVFPGSEFDSDFDAAIYLIHELRRREPGIYINLTTGTYPSPFWLFYADSIWRGGEDHSFDGVGSSRQRWITYRDESTYRNTVLKGPLFPLNSLMLHGIIYARLAEGLSTDPHNDFPSEVQSYFASGTQLQEMYITPSLLTAKDWDVLAHAAKWARANSGILEDTHWIGGDPGKLQVYGWAAWSPKGWIVTLRNPSDHPQTFSLDLPSALQLPDGAQITGLAEDPFGKPGEAEIRLNPQAANVMRLRPFEVRTLQCFTRDFSKAGRPKSR
jgi:hypothetical protein